MIDKISNKAIFVLVLVLSMIMTSLFFNIVKAETNKFEVKNFDFTVADDKCDIDNSETNGVVGNLGFVRYDIQTFIEPTVANYKGDSTLYIEASVDKSKGEWEARFINSIYGRENISIFDAGDKTVLKLKIPYSNKKEESLALTYPIYFRAKSSKDNDIFNVRLKSYMENQQNPVVKNTKDIKIVSQFNGEIKFKNPKSLLSFENEIDDKTYYFNIFGLSFDLKLLSYSSLVGSKFLNDPDSIFETGIKTVETKVRVGDKWVTLDTPLKAKPMLLSRNMDSSKGIHKPEFLINENLNFHRKWYNDDETDIFRYNVKNSDGSFNKDELDNGIYQKDGTVRSGIPNLKNSYDLSNGQFDEDFIINNKGIIFNENSYINSKIISGDMYDSSKCMMNLSVGVGFEPLNDEQKREVNRKLGRPENEELFYNEVANKLTSVNPKFKSDNMIYRLNDSDAYVSYKPSYEGDIGQEISFNSESDSAQGISRISKGSNFVFRNQVHIKPVTSKYDKVKEVGFFNKFDTSVLDFDPNEAEKINNHKYSNFYFLEGPDNKNIGFNVIFGTKKDGSPWASDEEMSSYNIEDLKWFDNPQEAYDFSNGNVLASYVKLWHNGKGYMFNFLSDFEFLNFNTSYYSFYKVKDDSDLNPDDCHQVLLKTYLIYDRESNKNNDTINDIKNGKFNRGASHGFVDSMSPKFNDDKTILDIVGNDNIRYIKSRFDKDGNVISGTHAPSSNFYGDTFRLKNFNYDVEDYIQLKTVNDSRVKFPSTYDPFIISNGDNKGYYNLYINDYGFVYSLPDKLDDYVYEITFPKGFTLDINEGFYIGEYDYYPISPKYTHFVDSEGRDVYRFNINGVPRDRATIEKNSSVHVPFKIESYVKTGRYKFKCKILHKSVDPNSKDISEERDAKVVNLASQLIYEEIDKQSLDINEEFTTSINYYNNSKVKFSNVNIFKILPYNGSGNNKFDGTYKIKDLKSKNGNKVYYTTDESVRDKNAKNFKDGINWIEYTGGEVNATAIYSVGSVNSESDEVISFTILPKDNKEGNVYAFSVKSYVEGQADTLDTIDKEVYVTSKNISGYVYEDSNKDGVKDKGEPVYKNKSVSLRTKDNKKVYRTDGTEVKDVLTDDTGKYIFENVPFGEFIIHYNKSEFEIIVDKIKDNKSDKDGNINVTIEKGIVGKYYEFEDQDFGLVNKFYKLPDSGTKLIWYITAIQLLALYKLLKINRKERF